MASSRCVGSRPSSSTTAASSSSVMPSCRCRGVSAIASETTDASVRSRDRRGGADVVDSAGDSGRNDLGRAEPDGKEMPGGRRFMEDASGRVKVNGSGRIGDNPMNDIEDKGAVMPGRKTKMTDEHKQALAEGRELGRAVRDYLEALEQNKPKRGRKRTPESVKKRLTAIEAALPEASPIKKVELIQERSDLTVELATMGTKVDLSGLEKGFVKSAKTYSERKGITYSTWREVGVPADVLKRAGITRGA